MPEPTASTPIFDQLRRELAGAEAGHEVPDGKPAADAERSDGGPDKRAGRRRKTPR